MGLMVMLLRIGGWRMVFMQRRPGVGRRVLDLVF